MKNKHILAVLFTMMTVSCQLVFSQNKTFTLTSNIKDWVPNAKSDSLYVVVYHSPEDYYYRTIPIVNGQINYTDTISRPAVYRISGFGDKVMKILPNNAGFIPALSSSVFVVIEPNTKIHLEGSITDFCDVYPSGTLANESMAKISKSIMPLINESVNTTLEIEGIGDTTSNKDNILKLQKKRESIQIKIKESLRASLLQKPYDIASLFYAVDGFKREMVELDDAEIVFKNTPRTEANKSFYDILETRIKASEFDIGNKMFEISGTTVNGDEFSTKKLLGKYYIIDFWGFWCIPCMNGMPKLKELKDKHFDKLEIVGINQGDSESTWKSQVQNDKVMTWIHLKNGKNDKNYVSKLNVTGYPTKILVGPDGTILYRVTGEHENFKEEIEKFLK